MTRRDRHPDRPRRMLPLLPRVAPLEIDHDRDVHGRPVCRVAGIDPAAELYPVDLRAIARQIEAAADLADGAGS